MNRPFAALAPIMLLALIDSLAFAAPPRPRASVPPHPAPTSHTSPRPRPRATPRPSATPRVAAPTGPLLRWRFSNGPEFPGATGAIAPASGPGGPSVRVTYRFGDDITRTGRYVAAYWTPARPLAVGGRTTLALSVRFDPRVRLGVRVRDASGQTLQYPVEGPTLEHRSPGEWERLLVPLERPATAHWGGYNDGRLRGAIAEIGLVVEPRVPLPVNGEVRFEPPQVLDTPDALYNFNGSPPMLPAPAGAASLSPRLGVAMHALTDGHDLDLARDAGFSFARIDLTWARVERGGRYDFSAYDAFQRAAEARGLGVLWILDYGHPAHGASVPRSAEDVAAFGRFAGAAATHFRGRRVRYEVWNEPNLPRFLPDPGAYPPLLRAAAAAIHAADRGARVVSGGVSRFDWPYLSRLLGEGDTAGLNALGVHPYRQEGPETVVGDLTALHPLVARLRGEGLPVWDTEWGYPSYGYFDAGRYGDGHAGPARRRQAVLAARELLTVWALGLPTAVWYDLRDDGPNAKDREHNFGLVDAAGQDKPAMRAVRTLSAMASGRRYVGLARDVVDGLHLMRLDGHGDVVLIAWNSLPHARHTLRFSRVGLAEARDVLGNPIQAGGQGGDGEVALAEPDGPVYLRWRTP